MAAHAHYVSYREVEQNWGQPLCAPSLACCLTLCGCGCIPIYTIITQIGPFTAVFLPITAECALFWALLLWIGTMEGVGQATIVFMLLHVIFAVGAKNHMNIREDDLWTAIKSILLGPCLAGQLAQAAQRHAAQNLPVGLPVGVSSQFAAVGSDHPSNQRGSIFNQVRPPTTTQGAIPNQPRPPLGTQADHAQALRGSMGGRMAPSAPAAYPASAAAEPAYSNAAEPAYSNAP